MIDLYFWPTPNGQKISMMLEESVRLLPKRPRARRETLQWLSFQVAGVAIWPWVAVRSLHRIDIDEFPQVKLWFEAIGRRPAVRRGMAVMADSTRIGRPDARTREVFFDRTQLRQGRKART